MRALLILLSPVLWSIRNDIISFNWSFYKKVFFYSFLGAAFIFLNIKLLNAGMIKLQSLTPDVFNLLLVKGYSFIFIIIFFIQIINGFVMSLDRYYQSKDLEMLLTSPVNRTSLFFSRLLETHLKTSWMLVIFGIPVLVSLGLLFDVDIIYYPYSFMLFMVFSTIPVNIGISITILLSGIFHIKRIKKFMFSAGIITVVVIITLLRLFRPERFVNPELFANLKLFLVELSLPSFILFPNRWLSESLFNYLNKRYNDIFIYTALLLFTSYITASFLIFIYKRFYYRGWSLLQGGGIILKGKQEHPNFAKRIIYSKPVQRLLLSLDSQKMMLLRKDLLYQFKDIKNIHQHLILFALIIIYIFSIASVPLNWVEYAVKLKYIISFFNLGLILIIIASLCSKLVYPAIVSEYSSLWIIKTSPLKSNKYVRTKFIFLLIPIFLIGQSLTIFSSFFIGLGKELFAMKILTTSLLSLSLVGMAVNFGISDLKNMLKRAEDEEIKTGNTIYMIVSVVLILFTLALEVIPIYLHFLRESAQVEFTQKAWYIIGGAIFVLLLINIFITVISISLSIKKFDNIQFN